MDIIFTSQANHLHTAQFLVKEYDLTNTALIHLHSKRTSIDPDAFAEQVRTELFSAYELLAVPHGLTVPNLHKLLELDAIYARVMERYLPERIYLFCQDRTYTLLIKQARKIGAKVYYIEGGKTWADVSRSCQRMRKRQPKARSTCTGRPSSLTAGGAAMLERLLYQAQKAPEDVDVFLFHQANAYMLEHLRVKCNIPREKFLVDL